MKNNNGSPAGHLTRKKKSILIFLIKKKKFLFFLNFELNEQKKVKKVRGGQDSKKIVKITIHYSDFL